MSRRASIVGCLLIALSFGAATTRPTVDISTDTTAAPACADFAARSQAAGEAYYATIAALLPTDGFTPPDNVRVTFKPMNGVAYTMNTDITCAAPYFTAHPNDVGAVIHELTHVVQHYTTGPRPTWLVEGIADWVRWFNWEPAARRPHANPRTARFDASYRTSAEFINWVQTKYDPTLVVQLNNALRKGYYRDRLWQTCTGHTLQQLGAEWQQSLRAATRPTP